MKIDTRQWKEYLRSAADTLGVYLDDQQISQMALFAAELISSNTKFNLTAITDPEEIAEKHLLDSIIPAKFIPSNSSVLDIGTGGGFPGIPLKIFDSSLALTLIDSSRKKINFLKYIIRTLKLDRIEAWQNRAEELADRIDSTGKFDVVISRAFSSLDRFCSLAFPVVKQEGTIIAMKGKDVQKEVDLLKSKKYITIEKKPILLNRLDINIENYILPKSNSERSLVIIKNTLK